MANPEHLKILLQGVEVWNKWRDENPEIRPDLDGFDVLDEQVRKSPLYVEQEDPYEESKFKCFVLDLSKANLAGVSLKNANLQEVKLEKTNLQKADLWRANLQGANLFEANLQETYLNETNLQKADLAEANLQGAHLPEANLQKADLDCAYLKKATLLKTNLKKANLMGASLQEATLLAVNLKGADLSFADLENADVSNVEYDRFGRYRGIRVTGCHGSQMFKRHAMDQAFIEELRVGPRHWRFWLVYLPWLVLADCGRSLLLWAWWSVIMACGFAWKFHSLGQGAFKLGQGLAWGFDTVLYYSVVTFTTLGFGDVTPITDTAKHWVMAEVILGYVMLGGLISIFANKLARRSG